MMIVFGLCVDLAVNVGYGILGWLEISSNETSSEYFDKIPYTTEQQGIIQKELTRIIFLFTIKYSIFL